MLEKDNELHLMDAVTCANNMLRREFTHLWRGQSPLAVTSSEWAALSLAALGGYTIADIAKSLFITRQAAHKCIKSLAEKGLVRAAPREDNRRVRVVVLTPLGRECCDSADTLKQQLDEMLALKLGPKELAQLKNLLQVVGSPSLLSAKT